MTDTQPPNPDVPVLVSAYDPDGDFRFVQVFRPNGTLTQQQPCTSHREFAHFVRTERPDVDVDDPAQVFWTDRPGEWSAA
jgi:hypothetical protein